jgi:hypothetical protein
MVQTPAVALSNVFQTSSANAPINFLKNAVVNQDTSWTTGCRLNGKQTNILEFNLLAIKKRNPTGNDMKTKLHRTRNEIDKQTRDVDKLLRMVEAHLQSKD